MSISLTVETACSQVLASPVQLLNMKQQQMNPILPPLYFSETSLISGLCSELETGILSYLSWGDHARLSCMNSNFTSLVHDAASASNDTKWAYVQALLHGTHGLQVNIPLAVQYLKELANVDSDSVVVLNLELNALKDDADTFPNTMVQPMSVVDYDDNNDDDNGQQYHIDAMMELAFLHLEQKLTSSDQDEINSESYHKTQGLAWLQQAYNHGHLQAAYELAVIYEYAKYGVEVDVVKAAEWFAFAARSGHVDSMYEYAMCLELGCGVEQNDQEALDWYTKAANAGCVISNYSVGEWFESARGGLPQSDTEAVLWYYKAAVLGDEDSKKALIRLKDIARIVVPGWATTLNV